MERSSIMNIENFLIFITALAMGVAIGHLQANHWAEIKERALKVEIEKRQCDEGRPFVLPRQSH